MWRQSRLPHLANTLWPRCELDLERTLGTKFETRLGSLIIALDTIRDAFEALWMSLIALLTIASASPPNVCSFYA